MLKAKVTILLVHIVKDGPGIVVRVDEEHQVGIYFVKVVTISKYFEPNFRVKRYIKPFLIQGLWKGITTAKSLAT